MTVPSRERERRDWTLIVFLIPLGIILIIIVGQLAIRMFPNWVINADMRSNLDPNSAPGQPASLLQPLLPQILTPMAWAENYLTPGAGGDISFPPFIVLEPTSTPTATPASPTPNTPSPTATIPSPTSTVIYTPTPTDDDDDNTPDPPQTCQDNTATNFGGALPCVYPPPTCQDNTALNFGDPLPCVYPTPTGYPSTPDPTWTQVTPVPSEIGNTPDNPPGSYTGLATINQNTYIVVNFSIVVEPTPDANYDLVLYEFNNFGYVYIDWVIVGISNDPNGATYYEVFNWGNGIPDTNSNVGDVAVG